MMVFVENILENGTFSPVSTIFLKAFFSSRVVNGEKLFTLISDLAAEKVFVVSVDQTMQSIDASV